MPRIRTIKPDFWTDEAITECSMSARLFFIGMWNFADDHGGIDGSPKQLKMKIFPADSIKIEPLIIELITHGLLIEYSDKGKIYLHIKGFTKHQFINRPSKPLCPVFEETMRTHGMLNDDSYTIGKGREGKGKDITLKHLSDYSDDFTKFWDAYPKKTGKGEAGKVWNKIKPPIDTVISALCWQINSRQWREGFIPLPTTYLNQRRWEDEPEKTILRNIVTERGADMLEGAQNIINRRTANNGTDNFQNAGVVQIGYGV